MAREDLIGTYRATGGAKIVLMKEGFYASDLEAQVYPSGRPLTHRGTWYLEESNLLEYQELSLWYDQAGAETQVGLQAFVDGETLFFYRGDPDENDRYEFTRTDHGG